MSGREAPDDDVVWLDDETETAPDDQFADLAGDARHALGRRTRIALALSAVVVVGAAIAAGLTRGHDEPNAAPSSSATGTPPTSVSAPTLAPAPQVLQPPRAVMAAVRTAFPTAELTSFTTVSRPETVGLYRIYNLRAGNRLLIITIAPPRPGDTEEVNRTATSVEIVQRLGLSQVSIQLRVEGDGSAPTDRDYAGIQDLILDARLLAAH